MNRLLNLGILFWVVSIIMSIIGYLDISKIGLIVSIVSLCVAITGTIMMIKAIRDNERHFFAEVDN